MSKYLRTAVNQLKNFYIKKILETGIHNEIHQELTDLTVSELKIIYNDNLLIVKKSPSTKKSKYFQ